MGAGDLGSSLVRRQLTDARVAVHAGGAINDDPRQRRLRVKNGDVEGTLADLPEVAARIEEQVLVAASTQHWPGRIFGA